jgi:hypothetical protein
MKKHLWNLLTVVLFAAIVAAVPVYWLFFPKKTFSEAERRYLAEAPKLSAQKLSDWSFDDKTEGWLADQMPLRNALVGVNAYATLLSGRQVSAEVYMDRDGYLVEAPVGFNEAEIDKRLNRIAKLGQAAGREPRLLIVPSTGWIRQDRLPKTLAALYRDGDVLRRIEETQGVSLVPIADRFQREGQNWYYRTDHHWTADGAFAAYEAYMRAAGHEPLPRDAFYHHTVRGYVGSTRSRSALWLTPADTITIDEPIGCDLTVSFSDGEQTYTSLFFYEHLNEYDWYPLFLDGNHPVTVIENNGAAPDAPVLLMVKDSFGNTLAPLLAPSYKTIVMVDPRYYKQSVAELAAAYGASELLFCYSIERIATDLNLKLLK